MDDRSAGDSGLKIVEDRAEISVMGVARRYHAASEPEAHGAHESSVLASRDVWDAETQTVAIASVFVLDRHRGLFFLVVPVVHRVTVWIIPLPGHESAVLLETFEEEEIRILILADELLEFQRQMFVEGRGVCWCKAVRSGGEWSSVARHCNRLLWNG